jgi:hypothetical protein
MQDAGSNSFNQVKRYIRSTAMRYLVVVIAVLGWFGLTSSPAQACSCFPVGPPCQAYGSASAVFAGAAVSMRRVGPGEAQSEYRERVFKFSVDQAYLGVVGTEIEVLTGSGGGDCGYDFTIGERYLVYAHLYNNRLVTGICTRTRLFAQAGEDLGFLGNLSSAAPGATIHGEVVRGQYPKKDRTPLPTDIFVKIEGNDVRREVRLDAQGRFRVTGVPPGKFKVTLQIPETLFTERAEQEVVVSDRGCGSVVYGITDNGRLSGTVFDIHGQPVRRILLSLIDPASDAKQEYVKSERTDDEGRFNFTAVQAGRYFLAVNRTRFPDPKDPTLAYAPAFYPGVVDQVNAEAITVGVGEKRTGLDIRMPLLRPPSVLTIEIVWDDGSPVAKAQLSLRDATGESDVAFGAVADENGRFKINGYVGQQVIVDARSTRPYVPVGNRYEPMERSDKPRITLEKPRETIRIVITKLR